MQTFLPYPDFTQSAVCLDRQRLGKQRVECLQILTALANPNYGWQNHPAVKMWRGYDYHLVGYGVAICDEWTSRGYKDNCRDKIVDFAAMMDADFEQPLPLFIGNPDFHASHRSNLLRKDYRHYSQFGWTEPTDLPYVWPV